jgi:hypothetical protein
MYLATIEIKADISRERKTPGNLLKITVSSRFPSKKSLLYDAIYQSKNCFVFLLTAQPLTGSLIPSEHLTRQKPDELPQLKEIKIYYRG